ncbi:5589_t:CDS:2, partial [Entrophospora sp. SA101]
AADIRKRYFTLSRAFHEDKVRGSGREVTREDTIRFQEAKNAYEVLSDENKRNGYTPDTFNYDEEGNLKNQPPPPKNPPPKKPKGPHRVCAGCNNDKPFGDCLLSSTEQDSFVNQVKGATPDRFPAIKAEVLTAIGKKGNPPDPLQTPKNKAIAEIDSELLKEPAVATSELDTSNQN